MKGKSEKIGMGILSFLIVGLALLVVLSGTVSAESDPSPCFTQLTTDLSYDANPAWSPDGLKITFNTNRADSREDIWVMNADGSNKDALTSTGSDVCSKASWSPDGSKITFWAYRPWGQGGSIWTMNADSSSQTKIYVKSGYDSYTPTFSPDGTKIVFNSAIRYGGGPHELYKMDSDGTNVVKILDAQDGKHDGMGTSGGSISYSPDGKWLAFESERSGNWDIWIVKPDGSGLKQLTTNSNQDFYPAWSPDGEQIAFTSDRNGNNDIWILTNVQEVINGETPNCVQLTKNSSDDKQPSWSPDGNEIVFSSDRSGNLDIWVVDVSCVSPELPDLTLSPESWDFGSVTEGSQPQQTFTITNDGTADLVINDVTTSCSYISISDISLPATITPSSSETFTATVDTTGLSGEIAETITILSNDPDEGIVDISVSGDVGLSDPQQKLLDLMNQHYGRHFYEEYYNYDDDLDCSQEGKCSNATKTDVSELDSEDIWIIELYPISIGLMQGDDLSCQIDGNTWYQGPDPEGRQALDLEVDLADFLTPIPGGSEARDWLETWMEGGVTVDAAAARAKAECDGEHEAEFPVTCGMTGSASGLPGEIYASGEMCVFYKPETDDLDFIIPDPMQLDAGIHDSLSEISRHYTYSLFDGLIDVGVDIDLVPEIGGKAGMRTPVVGPISPTAVVPALVAFVNVDGNIQIDSDIEGISTDLTVSGDPYIIVEGLHSVDSIESIKSPYYYELDPEIYHNLDPGDSGFRVHVKPDLMLTGEIHLPDPLPDIDVEWPLPVPEFEHREGACTIGVHSPVDLHVYDSMGRHVGLREGGIEKEIKHSNYFEIDDEKLITVPSSLDRINVIVVGKEHGTYDLQIRSFLHITTLEGESVFTSFDFDMKDVAIEEAEFDYLDIDFDELRKEIQNKVNLGIEINQAIEDAVGALDFDEDGIADVIDQSLDFDKPHPSLTTEDIEVGLGQDVDLSAKLDYLGDPVNDGEILFFVDDDPIGTTVTDASGTGSLNYQVPLNLNIWDHCLKIVFLGNEQYGPSHTVATLRAVNLPPHIQLMSPHNGETLAGTVAITGEVTDTDLAFLSLKIDGSEVSSAIPYNWDTRTYVDGLHLVELVAGDEFGNTIIERRLVYVVSPEDIKEDAITELEAISTTDKHAQKDIDKAIKHITKSLEDSLWLDASHLDPKHGHKVFDEEKKAVKHLMKITEEKGKHEDPAIVDDVKAVIDKLTKADELLAIVAISDAKNTPVQDPKKQDKVDHEIAKAEEELAKAYQELSKSKLDKAIDHYKKAWKHAQQAIKHAQKLPKK